MFTTLDNDNNLWNDGNCAVHPSQTYQSEWWLNDCVDINPKAVKPFCESH